MEREKWCHEHMDTPSCSHPYLKRKGLGFVKLNEQYGCLVIGSHLLHLIKPNGVDMESHQKERKGL